MTWQMQSARPDDALALARIMAGWRIETAWLTPHHEVEADARALSHLIARADVVVARAGAVPLGFLAREAAEIHALYLSRPARGRGIGARLLGAAKAARDDLALWVHETNQAARRFYAREGFTEVLAGSGRGNDDGLPDLRMAWRREGRTHG